MDSVYFGKEFLEFFFVLLKRIGIWLTGQGGQLAADELQLIVLAAIGISSSLCGTFLVFKKMTMVANSISHTILLGIIPAFLISSTVEMNLNALLVASCFAALLTAFLTEALHRYARLQEDASTGLTFTSLFALGIILATIFTKNAHIGAEAVMGNADALHPDDMTSALAILLLNVIVATVFYRPLKLICFDASFARSIGVNVQIYNYLLLIVTSITLVGAFRSVGVLMVLALIVTPALIARLFCDRLKPLLFTASMIALVVSLIGVALSRHLLTVFDMAVSTGGLTVTLLGTCYLVAILYKKIRMGSAN